MPAEPKRGNGSGARPAKPCPICGKPAVTAANPFCSERCRDVDLNKWLSGSYAIAGRKDEDEEQD